MFLILKVWIFVKTYDSFKISILKLWTYFEISKMWNHQMYLKFILFKVKLRYMVTTWMFVQFKWDYFFFTWTQPWYTSAASLMAIIHISFHLIFLPQLPLSCLIPWKLSLISFPPRLPLSRQYMRNILRMYPPSRHLSSQAHWSLILRSVTLGI